MDIDDIPEDFWIYPLSDGAAGALVQVPVGATHVFTAAADTQWFDNDDLDNDFGVQVTLLYPGAPLATGTSAAKYTEMIF